MKILGWDGDVGLQGPALKRSFPRMNARAPTKNAGPPTKMGRGRGGPRLAVALVLRFARSDAGGDAGATWVIMECYREELERYEWCC